MIFYRTQVETLDCGISVIQVLHKYHYNTWLNLEELKHKAIYNKNGIDIYNFCNLARESGIETNVLKGSFEDFKKINIKHPIVSIIKNENFLHYIIVEKITNKQNIIYFDPLIGKKKLSLKEFENMFFGIIIVCSRKLIHNSRVNNNKKNLLSISNINIKKQNIFFSFLSIFVILLSFILSFYLKLIFDQIAPTGQKEKFLLITFLFLLISGSKLVLSVSNEMLLHKIELKKEIEILNLYLEKIKSINWLKIIHMHESDHLKNFEIINKFSSFQSKIVLNLSSNIFCLLVSTIILIILNVKIFLITLLFSVISISISWIFQSKIKDKTLAIFNISKQINKNFLNYLRGKRELKLGKIDNLLIINLESSLKEFTKEQTNSFNFLKIYESVHQLLQIISPYFLISISLFDIWDNNASIGTIFLYMSLFNYFISSFNSLTQLILQIPILKQELENLNSFLNYPNEIIKSENLVELKSLKSINIKEYSFSYNGERELIKIKNLLLKDKVVFKGKNGSGKSTLIQHIATLMCNKNILYNNLPFDSYDLNLLRKQICFINNVEYFPETNIYQYIINKDNNNIDFFINNYKKYQLDLILEKLNLNLYTKIKNNGENFSQGQKQVIAALKIFSSNYSLFLLDEAFENIDTSTKEILFPILRSYLQNKFVIEISHGYNYLFSGKEINFESLK